MRGKAVSAVTWIAIIGLGIADADGWKPARILAFIGLLLWLVFVAIPWTHWYFRGGERPGGEDA
jgi:hypothetical protein